jgi:hypothetical protein
MYCDDIRDINVYILVPCDGIEQRTKKAIVLFVLCYFFYLKIVVDIENSNVIIV